MTDTAEMALVKRALADWAGVNDPNALAKALRRLMTQDSQDGSKFVAGDGTMKTAGGSASIPPLPLFGTQLQNAWARPSLSTFSTWLNRSGAGVYAATIVNGGAGYTGGDILDVVGGTASSAAQIYVNAVDGLGAITDILINAAGSYTVVPSNPVSVTGGTGTGATFNLSAGKQTTAADGTNGFPLKIRQDITGVNQTANLTAILKTIGAPPWTITAGVQGSGNCGPTLKQVYAPIILNNSVDSKAVAIYWQAEPSPTNNPFISVAHYSNTSPGHAKAIPTDPNTINGSGGFALGALFGWFRVTNDGSTLTFYISDDGNDWFEIYSEAANALTSSFDGVGFGLDLGPLASAANTFLPIPEASVKLWSWVES